MPYNYRLLQMVHNPHWNKTRMASLPLGHNTDSICKKCMGILHARRLYAKHTFQLSFCTKTNPIKLFFYYGSKICIGHDFNLASVLNISGNC